MASRSHLVRWPSLLLALALCACARATQAPSGTSGTSPVTRSEGPPPAEIPEVGTPGVVIVSGFAATPLPDVQQHVRAAFAAYRLPLRPFGATDTLLTTEPVLEGGRAVTYRSRLSQHPRGWLIYLDGAYAAPGDTTVRVALRRGAPGVAGQAWARIPAIATTLFERYRAR